MKAKRPFHSLSSQEMQNTQFVNISFLWTECLEGALPFHPFTTHDVNQGLPGRVNGSSPIDGASVCKRPVPN